MHELSIVETLIEQVDREVRDSGHSGRVVALDLVIGRLSGVNVDSIRFAFETLAAGTLVEGAEVRIAEPRAVCRCWQCDVKTEIDGWIIECPKCKSTVVSIEGGRDLLLQTIDLEDLCGEDP